MPRQQNAKQNDSVQSKEPTEADRKVITKARGEKKKKHLIPEDNLRLIHLPRRASAPHQDIFQTADSTKIFH